MKNFAKAIITDPTAVTAKLASMGGIYEPGMIFVEIPEEGIVLPNLVVCRYGLSIPYIRVQENQNIWVEPTVGEDERWIYTGFADCGGETPATTDQLIMTWLAQGIYATTTGQMKLGSKTAIDALIKGTAASIQLNKDLALMTALKSAFNAWTPVALDGGAALKTALAAFLALPDADYSNILSTKVFTE